MGRDKGALGCRLTDVADLPVAGLSNYRVATRSQERLGGGGGRVDLSLLQHGQTKPSANLRLDPSAFSVPAGGLVQHQNGKSHKLAEKITDPITHFRHEGLDVPQKWRVSKRSGYKHPAAGQTWTWAQDADVVASTGLFPRPEMIYMKASLGADGKRHPFVWGGEDMLPGATNDYVQCDRPADIDHIIFNDKESFPYCVREGHTEKRPVHDYWRSDRMWDVMYDDPYVNLLQRRDHGEQHKRSARNMPSHPAGVSTDWRLEYKYQGDRNRRQPSSEDFSWQSESEDDRENRVPSCSRSGSAPKRCNAYRRSSTARNANGDTATPRSTTPRRAAARDSGSHALLAEAAAWNRLQPSTPRIEARRGETTPRSATSRSTTPRSATGLSMSHLVVTRRDSTPRGVAPRGSTGRASARNIRKSASEAAVNRK